MILNARGRNTISYFIYIGNFSSIEYELDTPPQRNGTKLEFENFTHTKTRENENTQITTWRCTDRRCKGTGKTIEGFVVFLPNPHYHEANIAKKLVQLEKAVLHKS